jgi:hypothetical protein
MYQPNQCRKERVIVKLRYQAYFEAEVEAGAIYPRRFAVVDEIIVGVMYLLENSMMNDYDVSHSHYLSKRKHVLSEYVLTIRPAPDRRRLARRHQLGRSTRS